jgi:hypothetical protein
MRHPSSVADLVISLPDDIHLVFEDRNGYLYAQVTGPRDSHQISLAYWSRVAEQVRKRNVRKLLVHENLGDHEDQRDISSMIDALIAMGLDRIQVAFVVGRIELVPEMEHGEILALERGANGRVFGSVAMAERWLRHGSQ